MQAIAEMLKTHPRKTSSQQLTACIQACSDCAEVCRTCADACLNESSVAELVECITLNLNCADLCSATAGVLARRAGGWTVTRVTLETCAAVCRACAEMCEQHEKYEHCVVCARSCRACEDACRAMLAALPQG